MKAHHGEYHLAIVGSGISAAYTLIHLVSRLERNPSGPPIKVVVIEKSGEFWTGVPYGSRSSRDVLLISSLREFLPLEKERAPFVAWLKKNRSRLFPQTDETPGALTAQWLCANRQAMDEGRWDDLFIPRFTFGLYVQERLTALLHQAAARGILECELLHGDTLDIQQSGADHTLDVALAAGNPVTLQAKKVVLAIGSPQDSAWQTSKLQGSDPQGCFIEDLYVPSLSANLRQIEDFLQTPAGHRNNQVLIAGSNASALEALYLLNNSKAAADRIGKFLVVSPSGEFPHRINPAPNPVGFPPENLRALVERKARSAQEILEAVARDVANARAHGASIADMHGEISTGIITALDQLAPGEQQDFVARVGVEIGRLQRRAGSEYLGVVDRLVGEGKLEFVKGRLSGLAAAEVENPGFFYQTDRDLPPVRREAPVGITIGCVGSTDLARSPASLMQNLIRRKICTPNPSRRGFIINERYEASKNFYIMGPLIAGNHVGTVRIWHAESCHRIISMAQRFADVLIQE